MGNRFYAGAMICAAISLCTVPAWSQQATAGAKRDSSVIDGQGTAHITRVIPVPKTVSPEAQRMLARPQSDAAKPETLEARRTGTDAWQARAGKLSESLYPVHVVSQSFAGVPVLLVTPLETPADRQDRVLINLHGGGFNSDSGSLTETVPIANLTQTKVIAVLYRLAPEHPFPAAVDDAVAVYREALKTYKPAKIAIYGTSAGAILTGEVAVKIKQLGLPLPGALGIFSGFGDFDHVGDSQAMYTLGGLSGHLDPPAPPPLLAEYVKGTNPQDPVLSPLYADLHGMPPTLFITSGRDLLLSGTTILHRAFLRDGVDARLVVFEALPHAFWNDAELPESKEAYGLMANFFDRELGR
ncbi:alpha/beta hydrolase fold domain-containing protein [Edaphobacter paludis]|uniref:Alpha/beta hydrolase fold domain-containing protein n=1 Tax=Edaphobacter paludis TaxID=3035702 RepID=A0AAU7CUZ2_9BACT